MTDLHFFLSCYPAANQNRHRGGGLLIKFAQVKLGDFERLRNQETISEGACET